MLEGLLRLVSWRQPTVMLRDAFDVALVAFVIYRALLVVRGTRAMQMAAGLAIVFLIYLGSKVFGLATLHNLLSWLLSSVVLLVVVIFQNDIRRALIRMGGRAFFSSARERETRVIDEVVAAATELARHRMGALIAFEQDANILEFTKSEGIVLDAAVTRELLVSLFVPESVNKLHDGAVLIRDLKAARAGVFFPMPETKILDHALGSRHRAALGITEETDAVVVVVSEERGTISFCFSGNIVQNLDAESLRSALLGLLGRPNRKAKTPAKQGKIDSLASVVAPRGTPSTPRPTPPPVEPKSDGRSIAPKALPGTIRAPEPRAADSDRPPPSPAEPRTRLDSVPPSATSTPLPMSESVVLRSESRLMPPARSTFLSVNTEIDDSPTGDEP
ncbi:MAG: TIGR00159 family protein [Polyangiaceae bacterium]|nr:TIGR00159 family protein [Polyangiaceae bacterium]